MKKVMYGIVIVAFIGIVTYMFAFRNPMKQNPQRIIIRNGTTGVETILVDESKDKIVDELLEVDSKISGIHLWTSGYRYIVYFEGSLRTKDITIRGKNKFVSGILEYKTNSDIISIIEKFTSVNE